jgi:GH15 family glucan-1,4-alpha-glucosidase
MPAETAERLENYALIGDCHTAALVSCAGAIDWLCLPHFSSTAVLAALLDPQGGAWWIRPDGKFTSAQSYLHDSNVLQTRFECDTGTAVLTDCLVIEPASNELRPEHELLRVIECVRGELSVSMHFEPRAHYGARPLRLHRLGRLGWQCRSHGMDAVLQSDIPLQAREGSSVLAGNVRLRAGERAVASWSYANREICVLPALDRGTERCNHTVEWWRDWLKRCTYEGLHAAAVRRSLLTLKLLTSSLTGAVMAAPTTSLPEQIRGARNWDYRYCWIRDSAFATGAFLDLGCEAEGIAFQRWLLRAVRLPWTKLQVVYDLWGDTRLTERCLPHLRGFRDSQPVRIGNGASKQFQGDLYGELIAATSDFVARGGELNGDERRLLCGLAQRVLSVWREPDQGIWEKRNAPQHHTFSKAMCWVAIERLLQIDERLHLGLPVERLRAEQKLMREQIDRHGYDERLGAYVSHYGSRKPDASLLLLPRYGYIAARDCRMRGTFALIQKELTRGPFVWRYLEEGGLEGGEGSFLPCAFWAIEYLALAGDLAEACRRLEQLLSHSSPTGLFAEEFSPQDGGMLGNYPQALTHESLIGAVLTLDRALPGGES